MDCGAGKREFEKEAQAGRGVLAWAHASAQNAAIRLASLRWATGGSADWTVQTFPRIDNASQCRLNLLQLNELRQQCRYRKQYMAGFLSLWKIAEERVRSERSVWLRQRSAEKRIVG